MSVVGSSAAAERCGCSGQEHVSTRMGPADGRTPARPTGEQLPMPARQSLREELDAVMGKLLQVGVSPYVAPAGGGVVEGKENRDQKGPTTTSGTRPFSEPKEIKGNAELEVEALERRVRDNTLVLQREVEMLGKAKRFVACNEVEGLLTEEYFAAEEAEFPLFCRSVDARAAAAKDQVRQALAAARREYDEFLGELGRELAVVESMREELRETLRAIDREEAKAREEIAEAADTVREEMHALIQARKNEAEGLITGTLGDYQISETSGA